MSGYVGVNNKANNISKIYVGDSTGHAKEVSKAYVGVNNLSQLWYGNTVIPKTPYVEFVSNSPFNIFICVGEDQTYDEEYIDGCIDDGFSCTEPAIQYSVNLTTWDEVNYWVGVPYPWSGFMGKILQSRIGNDRKYHLYLRNGTSYNDGEERYYHSNDRLTLWLEKYDEYDEYIYNQVDYHFFITNYNDDPVNIIGYMGALLDYESLMQNRNIYIGSYCFQSMFWIPDDNSVYTWNDLIQRYSEIIDGFDLGYPARIDASKLTFNGLGDGYSSDSSLYYQYVCAYIFRNSHIIHSPKDLPYCIGRNSFYCMFENCKELLDSPEIPEMEMTFINNMDTLDSAYQIFGLMFKGCSSLIKAPKILPSTILAPRCYMEMFMNCTSLQIPPHISATSLVVDQYYDMSYGQIHCEEALFSMFKGCSSLITIPNLQIQIFSKAFDNQYGNNQDLGSIFEGCNQNLFSPNATNHIWYSTPYNKLQESYEQVYYYHDPDVSNEKIAITPSGSQTIGKYGLPIPLPVQFPSISDTTNIVPYNKYYLYNDPV